MKQLKYGIVGVSLLAGALYFVSKESPQKQEPSTDSHPAHHSHSGGHSHHHPAPSEDKSSQSENLTEKGKPFEDFELNPFPITKETSLHAWTSVDGTKSSVVKKLAHNALEEGRLLEENQWVESRELVYRKKTSKDLLTTSLENGEELKEMKVPGPDGVEYTMTVTSLDYETNPEGAPTEGVVSGYIEEIPNSEALLSFYKGVESGYISSESVNLNYDSRESGQFSLSSVNIERMEKFIPSEYFEHSHE